MVAISNKYIMIVYQWINMLASNLGVLLSYKFRGWPQNHVEIQNPSYGAVCQSRGRLECHICKD